MPPRRGASQHIYELGQQGRKTGVTLPDTGARDEHGLQPLDGLFSSPRKAETPRVDQTGELDMDLESSGPGPGPSTVLAAQKSARLQLPRARSPAKTNLKSPAVKNPRFMPSSSPSRGSIMRSQDTDDDSDNHTVTRRLDLQKTQLNGTRRRKANGPRRPTSRIVEEEEEDSVLLDAAPPGGDDSMQLVQDSPPPVETEPEEDEEEEERPKPARRGRPKGKPVNKAPPKAREPSVESEVSESEVGQESDDAADEEPRQPQRKPGRPPKKTAPATGSKRRERASPEPENQEPEGRGKKRQKTQARAPAPAKKPAGRKPKNKAQPPSEDPDASLLQVQRGPPLPRARGLVSIRRDSSIQQTRSGRHSYRPLEFWKNERVEYETDAVREDMFRAGSRMVLPSIKEVIRVEEEEAQTRKRNPRPKGRTKGKNRAAPVEEEEEEEEEWERDVGSVVGDVILWEPEHELHPPGADDHVEVMESRLAVSSGAVQTQDIRGTTFQFAKTLNLSFMGTGVVDMPPGSEKKPKNSRKMQMVFFVFTGKVLVSVNETEFRISTGGQWFVPRGNYYSIRNDSDRPARLFFAQACEVTPALPEEE